MAGLYIHIPFCRKACAYCNFHFDTNLKSIQSITNGIDKELLIKKNILSEPLESIYFGGGTPSILNKEQIQTILQTIDKNYNTKNCLEYTLEVNPEDVTEEQLKNWKEIGFNRLSMGVQSFFDEDLKYMGRYHTENQSVKTIDLIANSDFKNYSIDLIYGVPGENSTENWIKNLEIASKYNFPHISAYALTVEPNTKLDYRIKKQKQIKTKDKLTVEQFDLLRNWAKNNGYNHYEISNLAQKNYKAIHNSNYWKSKNYLGIGPSAHSYINGKRMWNVANNKVYLENLNSNTDFTSTEKLSIEDKFNEWLMIGLRTKKGISKEKLYTFPTYIIDYFKTIKAKNKTYLKETESHYYLPDDFWMISDNIISDFFFA